MACPKCISNKKQVRNAKNRARYYKRLSKDLRKVILALTQALESK